MRDINEKKLKSGIKIAGIAGGRTESQAMKYEKNRFAKRGRGKRLNKVDQAFAMQLLTMIGNESSVLDVPCGSGRFHDVFSRAEEYVMVDFDPNMLKVAKERYGEAENVTMLQGDITALQLSDNSIDLCFCMRLFHHIDSEDNVSRTIKELSRVSKRYVAFSFYNQNCWRYLSRKLRGKKVTGHYYSSQLIDKFAREAGLELVHKNPKFNLLEQQCLVLYEKVQTKA
ncbi:class I SAM-dependent methyltransferase [Candidatus Pacearchaeota archaeon]|nr:class I SAM-dependent methyltransferase [Candidatus Pacearchaeota archaeon]